MTRKVVKVTGVTQRHNLTFIEALFEAFEEGYRPAPKDQFKNADIPRLMGGLREAYLYSKDHDFGDKDNKSVTKEVVESPTEQVEVVEQKEEVVEPVKKATTTKKSAKAK